MKTIDPFLVQFVAAVGLIVSFCSCGAKTPEPAPTPGHPISAADALAMQRAMHKGFIDLARIRRALAEGDLAGAQASGERLAATDFSAAPPTWKPHADAYRAAAGEVHAATDLAAAARAATAMAVTCGDCHGSTQASLGLDIPARPDPASPFDKKTELPAHMQLHKWGIDLMWDALVVPSDEAWQKGVAAFGEAALGPDPKQDGGGDAAADEKKKKDADPQMEAKLQPLRELTHEVSGSAGQSETAQRAETVSKLLAVCADCHRLARAQD